MENHENYNQGEFFDFNEFTLHMISPIFLKMTFFVQKIKNSYIGLKMKFSRFLGIQPTYDPYE